MRRVADEADVSHHLSWKNALDWDDVAEQLNAEHGNERKPRAIMLFWLERLMTDEDEARLQSAEDWHVQEQRERIAACPHPELWKQDAESGGDCDDCKSSIEKGDTVWECAWCPEYRSDAHSWWMCDRCHTRKLEEQKDRRMTCGGSGNRGRWRSFRLAADT